METNINIKLISENDIKQSGCINFDLIIDDIESVFKEYAKGKVLLPDKISQVFNEETQNRINCMPATLLREQVCGVKWVSVFPENPGRYNVPNVSGVIILSELKKGYPFAVIDGTLITALRTACMGAIGAKYLAKKNSLVYGTIGTGEQAKMHFRFIKHVVPSIKICNVASRSKESEKDFVKIMKKEYPDVEFRVCHSNYRKASYDADIIVTAVSCQSPLLKADAIKKGAYYCHVGGWEDEYEVPLKADKIVCDNWESLKHRGSPTIAKLYNQGSLKDEDIYSNIADIILGNKVGRESNQEFIYFNAIGLAFVDIALAYSFYKTVEANQLGELWSMR